MSYHNQEKYLFRKKLGAETKHYINVKKMGMDTQTVDEAGTYAEASRLKEDYEKLFPNHIIWISPKPTAAWAQANTQPGETRQ